MSKARMDALEARMDVLALALTALVRAVPPELVAGVRDSLRSAVAQRLDGGPLPELTDEALATDLARLMSALDCRTA